MPVVAGFEKFKEAMVGNEDNYVLIGGGACSILFDEAGAAFRATKDLDVVVITDGKQSSFGKAMWKLIREGGYNAGKRREGGCTYYRFSLPDGRPNVGTYPGEIELFSRHPDFVLEDESSHVAPLPLDDVVSSLSAIILDDGYYDFIRENVELIEGVPTLSPLHIIPLKMRAHIDNNRLHGEGVHISENVLRKHRADVVELSGLLSASARLDLQGRLRTDAEEFLADFVRYVSGETNRRRRIKLEEALEFLRHVYL